MTASMVRVREAHGLVLNWLVARATGLHPKVQGITVITQHKDWLDGDATDSYRRVHTPTEDWNEAGPLIEARKIGLNYSHQFKRWFATDVYEIFNDTESVKPLTAAMQMFVLLNLGEEVDVPDDVLTAASSALASI